MEFSHQLGPVDEQLLVSAPWIAHVTVDVDAPPSAVFEALASDLMWSWVPGLDKLRWVTPRPLKQGSIRLLRLGWLLHVEEDFFRWEHDRRQTFRVTSASLRVPKALVEDFAVEPTTNGTRVTWTAALDPGLPGARLFGGLFRLLMVPWMRWAMGGIRRLL